MNKMPRPPHLLLALAFLLPAGCHSSTAPPRSILPASAPATAAKSAPLRFQNQPAGIAFLLPGDWKQIESTPVRFRFTREQAVFTLDVPKLPWFLPPGFLTVDRVRDGYISDESKQLQSVQVTNLPDVTVIDAAEHGVKLTGQISGKAAINEAIFLVHKSRVYILSIDADQQGYPAARATLDLAIKSLQWID